MRTILSILTLLLVCGNGYSQITIPFDFTSEEENRLIKENDSLKYFVASTDTANTVVLNEEGSYYKLLNREHKVIAEGTYILEGEKYLQDGKWIQRSAGGKMLLIGYFRRGMPVGTWQEYYNTGKLKTVSNYGVFVYKGEFNTCLSGTWQEYYPDGKIKVNGFYAGLLYTYKDTVTVEDPVSGQQVGKVVTRSELRAEKTGHWEYYAESGELDRKEDY